MDRLTQEKQIGPFAALVDKSEAVPGAFGTYDCLYAHMVAVTRLKQYEDTGLEPQEVERIKGHIRQLTMRKCRAKMWDQGKTIPVEGLFHQWANQYEDCGDAGIANYTIALIETDDGRIVEGIPNTVVFLDREAKQNE